MWRTRYFAINGLSFQLSHILIFVQLWRMEHECLRSTYDPCLQIFIVSLQSRGWSQ
jgi:hypothetical protein